MARQPGYQMFNYRPPYWPSPSPYHSYPGPALHPHSLSSVTPAFTWPSHLPGYGQQLQGGGHQDDPGFQFGTEHLINPVYTSLQRPQ